jgi:DNA-binding transcriptional regulator WhiA
LIDGIEEHNEFINLMQNVSEVTYERPKTELGYWHSKLNEQTETVQKQITKEPQSNYSIENKEQIMRHTAADKQNKRKPHTEKWKLDNSLRTQKRWDSMTKQGLLQLSERSRKYVVYDHAFDKLSADVKYWIGYIMARGSIVKRSSSPRNISIKVSVLEEDRNHLERFRDFITPNRPIFYHEVKHVCELEFRSPQIVNQLEKYGIHNRMRYNEKVKKLEDEKDFWRGLIDGNGIFKPPSKRDNISIRANKGHELILQFKTFAEKILGRTIGRPEEEVKNWSLTLIDRDALELYRKLLYDKDSIALDRNLKWMNQVSSLTKYKTKT